jgi:hypothetical protein
MTSARKRVLLTLLGILAGTLIWAGEEALFGLSLGYLAQSILQGSLLGLVAGYVFGAAEGIAISEPRKAALTGLLGAAIGAAAGAAATLGASAALIAIANAAGVERAQTVGILLPASRVVAWALVGAVVAAVEGLRTFAVRRTVAGLVGGFVGGLLGGLGLEVLIRVIDNPVLGRAAGFLVLGASVGFFLGEFERRFSFARLRVLTGPLRNKEYVLSRRRTTIGSGLASQVYLRAYPKAESRHAEILESGGDMRITTSLGDIRVNEKQVNGERYLKYQDVIELGGTRLLLLPA